MQGFAQSHRNLLQAISFQGFLHDLQEQATLGKRRLLPLALTIFSAARFLFCFPWRGQVRGPGERTLCERPREVFYSKRLNNFCAATGPASAKAARTEPKCR